MRNPAHQAALDQAVRDITRVWVQAEEDLNRRLAAILRSGRGDLQFREVRRLNALLDTARLRLAAVEDEARQWLNSRFGDVYALGAGSTVGSFSWTTAHREALAQLARDTFDDCLKANDQVLANIRDLIRSSGARQAQLKVTTGQTAVQAGRDLRRTLLDRGIATVIYRDGTHVPISRYTQMLMRTKTAVAYNQGTIHQAVSAGCLWFELADGADCGLTAHGDPQKANGMIVSAEVAGMFIISHPNCRRDMLARPEVQSKEQASEIGSLRPPEQRADQAMSERFLQQRQQARGRAAASAARRANGRTPRSQRPRRAG